MCDKNKNIWRESKREIKAGKDVIFDTDKILYQEVGIFDKNIRVYIL